MNTQNITISQITADLIMALRSIEESRNNYYLGTERMRGNVEECTDHMTDEENTAFDNTRNLIEKEIMDRIRFWANTIHPASEI